MELLTYILLFSASFVFYKLFTCCKRRLKKLDVYRRHVLITGGGSGLGKEVARECFYKGAYLTLIGREKSHLLQALQELEIHSNNSQLGKFVQIFETDLSKNDKFEEILKQAETRFGPVYLFISCAGVNESGFFVESEVKTYRSMIENNYMSLVNSLLPISKQMCLRQKGKICVVASSLCYMPLMCNSALIASKAAVHGLAESIRPELEKHKIHLSIFSPGPIDTPGYRHGLGKKPAKIVNLEGSPISVEQACTELLRGISANDRYISTHFLYRILRISSLGASARSNSVIDFFLSGFSVLICCFTFKYNEFRTKDLKIKINI